MKKIKLLPNSGNYEDIVLGVLLLKNFPKEEVISFFENLGKPTYGLKAFNETGSPILAIGFKIDSHVFNIWYDGMVTDVITTVHKPMKKETWLGDIYGENT